MTTYKELLELKEEKDETKEKFDALLKKAWEIRDFEIELFWKRATYFSVLVGALFVGFYNIERDESLYKLLISFLGCFSSFVWWLSNRGSKFWQENWESHIDLLEKEVGKGEIYKLILGNRKGAFSVSKLNIHFSLIIFVAWIVITLPSLYCCVDVLVAEYIDKIYYKIIIMLIITGVFYAVMRFIYKKNKTKFEVKEKGLIEVDGSKIEYLKRAIS